MTNVGLADRTCLACDSSEMSQHVASLAIFSLPDGAGDIFVPGLVEKFRAARTFTLSGTVGVGFTGKRHTLPYMQRLAVHTGEALEELEGRLS